MATEEIYMRLISDLHMEFDVAFTLPELETDENTILIIAETIPF